MTSISFKEGIRQILANMNFTLSNDAFNLTERLLNELNSKLVESCSNVSGMNLETAKNVVDELFPENLKRRLIQDNRLMMSFSHAILENKPLKSVNFLLAEMQDEDRICLCKMLDNIAVKISDLVQSKNMNCIAEEDIRTAIRRILPQKLLHYALAEASRMILLYYASIMQEADKLPTESKLLSNVAKEKDQGKSLTMLFNPDILGYKTSYPASRNIRLSGNISYLKSVIFPLAEIEDDAEISLCEMLENLAVKISNLVHSKSKDNIAQEDITTAISSIFPQELLVYALTEASRRIILFEASMLEDAAESPTGHNLSSNAAKEIIQENSLMMLSNPAYSEYKPANINIRFFRDIFYLKSLIFPLSAIEVDAEISLCEMLENVALKISQLAKSKSKNIITQEDIRTAISNILPQELLAHALAEATHMTFLHTSSLQETGETATELGLSPNVVNEMYRGTKMLYLNFGQELLPQSLTLIVKSLSSLLCDLIAEMKKCKRSVMGPAEVRRAVLKMLPKDISDLAVSNMSRAIMT